MAGEETLKRVAESVARALGGGGPEGAMPPVTQEMTELPVRPERKSLLKQLRRKLRSLPRNCPKGPLKPPRSLSKRVTVRVMPGY